MGSKRPLPMTESIHYRPHYYYAYNHFLTLNLDELIVNLTDLFGPQQIETLIHL